MRDDQLGLLRQLSSFHDLAEFEASGLELGDVVRTMLDEPGQSRKATKPVVKAFAEAFQATLDLKGRVASRYPQAIEMLAYATVVAPLLEADQLARVVELASGTVLAYEPFSVLAAREDLFQVLAPHSPKRRERLVKDLWEQAHRVEWWHTNDDGPVERVNVRDSVWNSSPYGSPGRISEEYFHRLYSKAPLFERVLFASSPHFTDTDQLAADLRAAATKLGKSYKQVFLKRARLWTSSTNTHYLVDKYSEGLKVLEDWVDDSTVSPGKFINHGVLAERRNLGGGMYSADTEAITEVLGEVGVDDLWKLRSLAHDGQLNLPRAVFEAMFDLGSLFANETGYPFSGLQGGSCGDWVELIANSPQHIPFSHPLLNRAYRSTYGAVDPSDPHVRSKMAFSTILAPSERPPSNVTELAGRAADAVAMLPESIVPKKPDAWMDMAGAVGFLPFTYPETIEALDKSYLPGLSVELTLVSSPAALKANSEQMGNCTNAYLRDAKAGRWAVFHFTVDGTEHNASVEIHDGVYSIGEINTRFNRGGVDPATEAAFAELVAGLNA